MSAVAIPVVPGREGQRTSTDSAEMDPNDIVLRGVHTLRCYPSRSDPIRSMPGTCMTVYVVSLSLPEEIR